jgi:hypothetical protein
MVVGEESGRQSSQILDYSFREISLGVDFQGRFAGLDPIDEANGRALHEEPLVTVPACSSDRHSDDDNPV